MTNSAKLRCELYYPLPLRFHTDRLPSHGIEPQSRHLHQARLAMNDLIMSRLNEAIVQAIYESTR